MFSRAQHYPKRLLIIELLDIRSIYEFSLPIDMTISIFIPIIGINQRIVPIKKMIMHLWKINIFIRLTEAMYKSRGIYFGSRPAKFPPTFAYVMQLRKVIIARMFKKFRHTYKQTLTLHLPILQKIFRNLENICDEIPKTIYNIRVVAIFLVLDYKIMLFDIRWFDILFQHNHIFR